MLLCIAYYESATLFGNTGYKIFDTNTKSTNTVHEYELIHSINNGMKVKNLKVENNRIVGNGIDLKKLYYDGTDKLTVLGEVFNEKDKLIGYDAVSASGNMVYLTVPNATQAAKYGKVINLSYVELENKNAFVRLLSKDDIYKRVQKDNDLNTYKNMDTQWNTDIETAIKIFKANGFKLGYKKEYQYKEITPWGEELNHKRLCIMYDNNKNVIYFNHPMKPNTTMSSVSGNLVMQSLNDVIAYNGSSGTDTSEYTGVKYRYNTFDIREGIMKSYKSIISNQQPVPFLYDNSKGFTYQLGISTSDIKSFREKLTNKYFHEDDLKAFGFEHYIFLMKEYNNFSDELKQIFKLLHDNVVDMFLRQIVNDIIIYDNKTSLDKQYYNKMLELLKELDNTYNLNIEWESSIQNAYKELRGLRAARAKKQKEEEKVRSQANQSKKGLFNLFSRS